MNARDTEIVSIRSDLDDQRQKYENILDTKLALDTEIAVYKALLDEEEKRTSRLEERELKRQT